MYQNQTVMTAMESLVLKTMGAHTSESLQSMVYEPCMHELVQKGGLQARPGSESSVASILLITVPTRPRQAFQLPNSSLTPSPDPHPTTRRGCSTFIPSQALSVPLARSLGTLQGSALPSVSPAVPSSILFPCFPLFSSHPSQHMSLRISPGS